MLLRIFQHIAWNFIAVSILISSGSALWCFKCSEVDGGIKVVYFCRVTKKNLGFNLYFRHIANRFQNKYEVHLMKIPHFSDEHIYELWHQKGKTFYYRRAKIDHSLKCPTEYDYIEKWKNCSFKNHIAPSYDSYNHSCIIGSINDKIIFQVSFDKKDRKWSMAAKKSPKFFRKHFIRVYTMKI